MSARCRVLLVGGGHSHVEVLRRFARAADSGVALTLVSPDAETAYSGMLPGLVAGIYEHRDAHIALPPLAAAAAATWIADRVAALDLATRCATLAGGSSVGFDLVSLDVGSVPDTSERGAREHALPVKPVAAFLRAWDALRARAAAGALRRIVVVGGGAGGVEVLLAMQARLVRELGTRAPAFALCTDQQEILAQHPALVRARFAATLAERGVVVHAGHAVVAVETGQVRLADGKTVEGDAIVWATAASAYGWLAASGLACDERGFVCVDDHLRSVSHPFVFAAGDCATQVRQPRPKAGVFAVRQGPPLATNLRRAAHGRRLQRFVPQREALALITTGDRHAVASRGPFVAEGNWVWRWKDRIDRRFMAKYRVAGAFRSPAEPTP